MKQISPWVHRRTLELIYKPHLDYGDIIYDVPDKDNNTLFSKTSNSLAMRKVESVQYEAAIVVSGARHGTSRDKLNSDLGLEFLYQRRSYRRFSVHYIKTLLTT